MASRSFLDKVPLNRIGDFEKAWLEYVTHGHKEFMSKLKSSLVSPGIVI